MKRIFNWLPVMLLAATSVGFVSCGDDDEEEVVPAAESVTSEAQTTGMNVKDNTPEGVVAVDLGLPSGTKWANMNIGATSETEHGSYFAWGEIEAKSTNKSAYSWYSYLYGKDKNNVVNIGSNIAGTKYDAARMKWGGTWAMPTESQIRELLNHTTSEMITEGGVQGRIFLASNGNKIFLPVVGSGDYWSANVNPSNAAEAFILESDQFWNYSGSIERCKSCAIRPVIPGKSENSMDGTSAEASYKNGVLTVKGIPYKMVCVSGGHFSMGTTLAVGSGGSWSAKPVHSVAINNYYIGQTEVTQALWKAVMEQNPSNFKGENLPVECVSWNDCQTFITRLNQLTGLRFRLPTEAEWEFAASGGKEGYGYENMYLRRKFSGSSSIDDVAWYHYNSGHTTHPVATKNANELGLYDMSGNVMEWCQDFYEHNYYESSPVNNPTGPSSGSDRVSRGGSWYSGPQEFCYVFTRFNYSPSRTDSGLGFRLAL